MAKAVGNGYFPLQMPWRLAHAVRETRETVAGHRLGALGGGGGLSISGWRGQLERLAASAPLARLPYPPLLIIP